MKTNLILLTLVLFGVAFAVETQPVDHKLTGDEKAAIYKALYEQTQAQQQINAGQQNLKASQEKLQAALNVCANGVSQDDKTGDIDCAPKPAEVKK